ncbi:MAG: rod shape-determining protein MreD [Elusimicrobiaceae bacterium]|nr:rod shape-determining protein MreD [Elusimicrobiaceae bacterium]
MYRILNLILIFVIATIFYWLGLIVFAPLELSVNMMLAFSIIIAVILPQRYGYTFAFFSGLFLDFLGTSLFGSHALAFTVLMVLFYQVRDKIDFKESIPQMIITGMLNVLFIFIFGFLSKVFTGIFVWQGWRDLIFGSVVLGLIMPIFYNVTVKFLIFDALKKANEN